MAQMLIIIDMLHDFVDPGAPLFVPGASEIVPGIDHLRDTFRNHGDWVFHLTDAHAPDDPEFETWPPHAVFNTPGAEIIPELTPKPGELHMRKVTIDTFGQPEFASLVQTLAPERIVVCGVATEYCIQAAALGGASRNIPTAVAIDAVRGVDLNPGDTDRALAAMRDAGVVFMHVSELVR